MKTLAAVWLAPLIGILWSLPASAITVVQTPDNLSPATPEIVETEAAQIQEIREFARRVADDDPADPEAARLAEQVEEMWQILMPALEDLWAERALSDAADALTAARERLESHGPDARYQELVDIASAKLSYAMEVRPFDRNALTLKTQEFRLRKKAEEPGR